EQLLLFRDECLSLFEQRLLFGEFGFLMGKPHLLIGKKMIFTLQESGLFLRESAADRPAGATLEQRDSGKCPAPFSWNKL
ncbi:hypothetical protein, partial [Thiolapillus sp.]|uniref:hypothetical protein n=1 Tax=Thiolapillus sp. TaxID=2017437 RepID=UPI003AF740BB